VPDLPIDRDGDDDRKPGCRELLAVYGVRRHLERVAGAHGSVQRAPMAIALRAEAVRELRELISAIDRRAPHVERVGEASIAREAAALKDRALKRIEELEREPSPAESR
jgi:hypothetical protein